MPDVLQALAPLLRMARAIRTDALRPEAPLLAPGAATGPSVPPFLGEAWSTAAEHMLSCPNRTDSVHVLAFDTRVALPKESGRLSFDRDGVRHAGQRSCVLHAAGSSKIVLQALFAWRERMRGNRTFGDILATTRVYSPTKALGFYRHAVRGSLKKKQ